MAVFLVGIGVVSPASVAQEEGVGPAPFPEFTFKRVRPPSSGADRRIKVQIAPSEPGIARPAPDAEPETAPAEPAYAWFWEEISPALEAQSGGRLEAASARVAKGIGEGQIGSPRLEDVKAITDSYGIDILAATVGKDVSPALVAAVIYVESAGDAEAVSRAGAEGLMQLVPATAERFGVEDRLDPVANIRGGVAFLAHLLDSFERDPVLVLAAYNAGENAVRTAGGVPEFEETRGYVPKVIAAWSVARGLCQTPPELFTDGCVFVRGEPG